MAARANDPSSGDADPRVAASACVERVLKLEVTDGSDLPRLETLLDELGALVVQALKGSARGGEGEGVESLMEELGGSFAGVRDAAQRLDEFMAYAEYDDEYFHDELAKAKRDLRSILEQIKKALSPPDPKAG